MRNFLIRCTAWSITLTAMVVLSLSYIHKLLPWWFNAATMLFVIMSHASSTYLLTTPDPKWAPCGLRHSPVRTLLQMWFCVVIPAQLVIFGVSVAIITRPELINVPTSLFLTAGLGAFSIFLFGSHQTIKSLEWM